MIERDGEVLEEMYMESKSAWEKRSGRLLHFGGIAHTRI